MGSRSWRASGPLSSAVRLSYVPTSYMYLWMDPYLKKYTRSQCPRSFPKGVARKSTFAGQNHPQVYHGRRLSWWKATTTILYTAGNWWHRCPVRTGWMGRKSKPVEEHQKLSTDCQEQSKKQNTWCTRPSHFTSMEGTRLVVLHAHYRPPQYYGLSTMTLSGTSCNAMEAALERPSASTVLAYFAKGTNARREPTYSRKQMQECRYLPGRTSRGTWLLDTYLG